MSGSCPPAAGPSAAGARIVGLGPAAQALAPGLRECGLDVRVANSHAAARTLLDVFDADLLLSSELPDTDLSSALTERRIGRVALVDGPDLALRAVALAGGADDAVDLQGGPAAIAALAMLLQARAAQGREARLTARALRLAEARLRDSQRQAEIGSWELDLPSNVLYWSDEVFRIFEIDAARFDASYEAFLAAIHPDDRNAVNEAYRVSLRDRRPYQIRHRLLMPDGRIKYVEERCESDFAADGWPLRSRGTVQDITRDVAAEREMAKLWRAAELSLDAFAMTGPDGRLSYVNRAYATMFGLESAEAAIGRAPFEYGKDSSVSAAIVECLRRDGAWHGEMQARRRDGSTLDLLVSAARVDDPAGELPCFVVAFADISALRRALADLEAWELRQREIATELDATLKAIPDLLLEIDAGGHYRGFWARRPELLPADPSTLVGRNVTDVLPPAAASEVMTVVAEALAAGSSYGRQVSVPVPAGASWFELSAARRDGPTGTAIVLSRDVTARKQAELALLDLTATLEARVQERTMKLEQARDVAQRANDAKNEFLSRMSHELRTPLNSILGYAQLLEVDECLPAESREEVALIAKAGWHLLDLINDLLDFSKIEAGKLDLSVEPLPLGPALADALATIRPLAGARGLRIDVAPLHDAIAMRGDRRRVHQVLINVLSNAVKYNRDSGHIAVRCAATADGMARIEVEDSGVGIRADDLPLLFQPFSRLYLEAPTIEGSGIGLALSRQLVEAMGGQISAESRIGEGSTFAIELPLASQTAAGESGRVGPASPAAVPCALRTDL